MVTTAIAIDIITTSSIYFLILTYFNFNLSSILRIYTTIICINFLKVSLFSCKKNFYAQNWCEWKLQININIRHPLQKDLFYVVFLTVSEKFTQPSYDIKNRLNAIDSANHFLESINIGNDTSLAILDISIISTSAKRFWQEV